MINNDKMTKEEALNIAKTWNFLKDKNKEALETLVPELQPQESEDEKIKKALISFVGNDGWKFTKLTKEEKESWIAWIEKQCKEESDPRYKILEELIYADDIYQMSINDKMIQEAKEKAVNAMSKIGISELLGLEKQYEWIPVLIIPKFRIGDEIKTSNEKSLTITKIDEKGYWSEDLFICDFDEECLWDLVEKKPGVKAKPKFHEGDWVASDYNNVAYIESISETKYNLQCIDGFHEKMFIKYVDRYWHLWTIEDAKDGDILSAYECIVVFKEIDGLNIKCHCTYHYMNNPSFHVDTLQNKTAFHPATKEQWDQLKNQFKKAMNDAGYEWDAEKRELIKIKNSNPTNVVNEPKLTKEDIDNLNKISKVIYEAGQVQCWYRGERIISTEESDRLCDWLKSFYNKLNLL